MEPADVLDSKSSEVNPRVGSNPTSATMDYQGVLPLIFITRPCLHTLILLLNIMNNARI